MKRPFDNHVESVQNLAPGDSPLGDFAGATHAARQGAVREDSTDPARATRPGSRERILDAALRLFGEKGFEATSVRDLAAAAEVNLAAINYHFRSKENLRFEALRYGFSPIMQPARKMQSVLLAAQEKGTIEAAESALNEAIHIFVREVLGNDQRHYAMFLRERLNPGPGLEMVAREYFAPIGQVFEGILRMLLPHHSRSEVGLCITSIIGQCLHIRIEAPTVRLMMGQDPSSPEFLDFAATHIARFSMFAVRGMRGTAQQQPS